MDNLKTVGAAVNALVHTYSAALESYIAWQRRRWQANHYRTRRNSDVCSGGFGFCAVSASLSTSGPRIKEVFEGGVDVFGDDFAMGDDTCLRTLQEQLERLQRCADLLHNAAAENPSSTAPLALPDLIRVSESARAACLAALAKQYQRVAVGRLMPRRRAHHESWLDDVPERRPLSFVSTSAFSPPSPPPTPKPRPDLVPSYGEEVSGDRRSLISAPPQPRNGVFNVFCAEALRCQVNPRRELPEGGKCRCGYEWRGKGWDQDKNQRWKRHMIAMTMAIHDGFQITGRFLGKSHCAGGGFGMSSQSRGKTEKYQSAEELRDHINTSHSKWQLLHDQDMMGR
ncbi:hypothetical protein F5X96DRAFT_667405 [Biscogniauxia mediterranea]|nr:hypothetical protein F5X96DRAFT_667405 [Biscogniauxia mediterranea]